MIEPGTHSLKLWDGHAAKYQPRDRQGRFVRVRHTPQRLKVLARAAELRAQLGLPADPRLHLKGSCQ